MKQRSFFQGTLIATASLVVGMVIASRLDLTPSSLAGSFSTPAVNSSPLTGPLDATTFRTIAHDASPGREHFDQGDAARTVTRRHLRVLVA